MPTTQQAVRHKGVVKWFEAETRGYGFITPETAAPGDRDVFVHISAVRKSGLTSLDKGCPVEYELGENHGKTVAVNLILLLK